MRGSMGNKKESVLGTQTLSWWILTLASAISTTQYIR